MARTVVSFIGALFQLKLLPALFINRRDDCAGLLFVTQCKSEAVAMLTDDRLGELYLCKRISPRYEEFVAGNGKGHDSVCDNAG